MPTKITPLMVAAFAGGFLLMLLFTVLVFDSALLGVAPAFIFGGSLAYAAYLYSTDSRPGR